MAWRPFRQGIISDQETVDWGAVAELHQGNSAQGTIAPVVAVKPHNFAKSPLL